jgi:L-iditol 2-dehydrogenase
VNGQELSRVGEGDIVVVIGAGPIGCMHIAMAKQKGAKQVISVEISAPRLEQAKKVGADLCIDAGSTDSVAAVKDATGGWGADCVIVAAGAVKAQEDGIKMAARRGRVNLFGGVPKTAEGLQMDSNVVHYEEVFVHGAYGSTARQHAHALDLMATGRIDPHVFISQALPFEKILEGFAIAEQQNSLKVVLDVAR